MGTEAFRGRHMVALGLVLLVGLVAALYLYDPAGSRLYPPCPFHALTGLYCPGCGSLRALHALLHGNVRAAFGLNPLMVLSLPFLVYAFVCQALVSRGSRRLPRVLLPASVTWVLVGAILAYWVLRNIPVHPFCLLAP